MATKKETKKTEKKSVEKPKNVKIVKSDKPVKTVKSNITSKKKSKVSEEKPIFIPEQTPSEEKLEIISQFQVKEGDTGSPEVQVALLTKRIEKLVTHLKTNPLDNHSRRGLLGIVSKRRRLLNYLEKRDSSRYKEVVGKIGLK